MDARVIRNVHRAGLGPAGIARRDVRLTDDCRSLATKGHRRIRTACSARKRFDVDVAFELVDLPATQRPRICSEADVKHGYEGDRRCFSGEFH